MVNHSWNFIDPDDPDTYTQQIKGLLSHAKKKIWHQCGTSKELFHSYLSEFLWQNWCIGNNNHFAHMLAAICEQYPL